MKKIIILMIISFLAIAALHADDEYKAIPISFTYNKTVYAGYSKDNITTTEQPAETSRIDNVGFRYVASSGRIESNTPIWVYCISFLPQEVEVWIKTSGKLNGRIPWTSNHPRFSSDTTNPILLITDPRTDLTVPGVLKRQLALTIDPLDVPNEAGPFTTTITMEVRTKQ